MQKPTVRGWHREAYDKGERDSIPAEALKVLDAEKKPKAEDKKKKDVE